MEERILMTGQDLDRQHVLRQVIDRQITQVMAGKQLKLSDRQIRRLVKRFKAKGAKGLIHQLRGKVSNRCLSESDITPILDRIKACYPDFGPTLAHEKLIEDGYLISLTTLRKKMILNRLWVSKLLKPHHRDRRERRSCLGELIQFDGSYHAWFEDRGPTICLLLAIDDATGKLMDGEFVDHEKVDTCMRFWKNYLLSYHRPVAIYLDRHSVYKTNRPILNQGEPFDLTQFARAMEELNIQLINAYSPEAKGRVERSFQTHQDRLVKELRLAKINDPVQATKFFREIYLPKHNAKFAVEPRNSVNAHRSLRPMDDLNRIFSIRDKRIVARDFTVRYQSKIYQLIDHQPITIFPKTSITLETHLDQTLHLIYKDQELNYIQVTEPRPINQKQWALPRVAKDQWRPASNHPWRRLTFSHSPFVQSC